MEFSNYKCDICGAVAVGKNFGKPKGWHSPMVSRDELVEGDFWNENKDVCPDCGETSGLFQAYARIEAMATKAPDAP